MNEWKIMTMGLDCDELNFYDILGACYLDTSFWGSCGGFVFLVIRLGLIFKC